MSEDSFANLIMRAFLSLDTEERKLVLAELTRRGVGRSPDRGSVLATGTATIPAWLQTVVGPPAAADQSTLLVRLSRDQHEALKVWCAQHQFSIATVIRGLVDRFLDQQNGR